MCLNAGGMKRQDSESETLIPTIGGGFDGPVGITLHGTDGTASVASFTDLSSSLRSRIPSGVENSTTTAVMQPVAFCETADCLTSAYGTKWNGNASADNGSLFAAQPEATAMQVRRLTPEECEALQGFPRSYTQIPWRKKPASECPDGPRYKALGNSWAVPVARWIGERINKVEAWTS
jgi:DNA (cytosine-5)-methyltransferase 1